MSRPSNIPTEERFAPYHSEDEEPELCWRCHGYLVGPPGTRLCHCPQPEAASEVEAEPSYETAQTNGSREARRRECSGHVPTFTVAELMAEPLPAVKWIVPEILPEGVTILGGKPKMGKSWMALGLAVAVASGGMALGVKSVERGGVLYLALEDNRRRLQKRLKKLLPAEAPARLHLTTDWPRMNEGGAEMLARWLREHPETRLVVVDILKRVRPQASVHRSVYEADYEALEAMQKLAGEHGIALLVVHHLRKLGATDPLDELSGSTGLSGAADGILILKRERGRAAAYLHITGREIEEEAELALKWDANLASWTLAGDAEEYRRSEEREAILRALRESAEPITPKEVAETLDKNPSTIRTLLRKMADNGLVKGQDGRYNA
jgi:DNA-binding transcriptional ArsR family regulator